MKFLEEKKVEIFGGMVALNCESIDYTVQKEYEQFLLLHE